MSGIPPEESRELKPDAAALPLDLARKLFAIYDTWWNKIGCYDPGRELISDGVKLTGIGSLVSAEDGNAMEDACAAVEPHAAYLRRVLGLRQTEPAPGTPPGREMPWLTSPHA